MWRVLLPWYIYINTYINTLTIGLFVTSVHPGTKQCTATNGSIAIGSGGGGGAKPTAATEAAVAAAPKLRRPPQCPAHGPGAVKLARVKKNTNNRWRLFFTCGVPSCSELFQWAGESIYWFSPRICPSGDG